MYRTTIRRSFMVRGLTRRTRLTTGARAIFRTAAQSWVRAWRSAPAMHWGAGQAAVTGAATSTGTTTTSISAETGTGIITSIAGRACATTPGTSPTEWARVTAATRATVRTSAGTMGRPRCGPVAAQEIVRVRAAAACSVPAAAIARAAVQAIVRVAAAKDR